MSEQPAAETSAAPTGRLTVQAVLKTDVGLVRSENQDLGSLTTPDEEKDHPAGGRLLIVADGMGGHRGGATASRLAAETVKAQYLGSETADIAVALKDSLTRANARIFSEAQANPDLRGMGTTTSALVIRGRQAWFAHVGDSRIYLCRGEEIRQLTDDHSLVASMVREGLLTQKEAEVHPRRNVLQRSMGVAEDVEIDIRGPFGIQEGDVFILCSDGLHGLVKEDELKEIARLQIQNAADEYIRRALERGAPDNVTVIVARIIRSGDGLDTEDFGDETLLDDKTLDSTQPLGSMELGAFDETQRDTAPVRAVRDAASTAPTLETPAAAAIAGGAATAATLEVPVAAPEAPVVTTAEVPAPAAEPVTPEKEESLNAAAADAVPAATVAQTPLPESAKSDSTPTAEVPVPDTQPGTAAAASDADTRPTAEVPMLDETVKTGPFPKTVEMPQAAPAKPAAKAAVKTPEKKSGGGVLKWIVILALLGGGSAGAWWYWNQQKGAPAKTSAPASRR